MATKIRKNYIEKGSIEPATVQGVSATYSTEKDSNDNYINTVTRAFTTETPSDKGDIALIRGVKHGG